MTAKEIIENGYYEAAVALMDDEIDLEFLEEYMKRYEEKYGIAFVV